jgi:hypothetical protein
MATNYTASTEWERESASERYSAALENNGEFVALTDSEIEERDQAWEERRSIWDRYQERYQEENQVEYREFLRKPAGMQGKLFEEVA